MKVFYSFGELTKQQSPHLSLLEQLQISLPNDIGGVFLLDDLAFLLPDPFVLAPELHQWSVYRGSLPHSLENLQ